MSVNCLTIVNAWNLNGMGDTYVLEGDKIEQTIHVFEKALSDERVKYVRAMFNDCVVGMIPRGFLQSTAISFKLEYEVDDDDWDVTVTHFDLVGDIL